MTLGQIIEQSAERLDSAGLCYGHGTDNAWDEAVWLVLHALGRSPADPVEDADEVLTKEQLTAVEALMARRIAERVPTAYLAGEAWFCGLPFYVNEDTLVPRSPIAELIGQHFAPWLTREPRRILDLCTGSGCIAVACALAFPEAEVVATDLSEPALTVARRNVERHGLSDRVTCLHSDVFAEVSGEFDLIVSNPPYVDAVDMAILPDEYRHEPVVGLSSGEDGLEVTRRILADAAEHLTDDGLLVVEVGNSEEALVESYPQVPFTWLEFEYGGHGVFTLRRKDLITHPDHPSKK